MPCTIFFYEKVVKWCYYINNAVFKFLRRDTRPEKWFCNASQASWFSVRYAKGFNLNLFDEDRINRGVDLNIRFTWIWNRISFQLFKTSNLFHAIYNFSENRINASDCRAIRKWKEKFSACNLWCAITAKPNCTWNSFQIFSRFYIIGNEIAGFGIMKSISRTQPGTILSIG